MGLPELARKRSLAAQSVIDLAVHVFVLHPTRDAAHHPTAPAVWRVKLFVCHEVEDLLICTLDSNSFPRRLINGRELFDNLKRSSSIQTAI